MHCFSSRCDSPGAAEAYRRFGTETTHVAIAVSSAPLLSISTGSDLTPFGGTSSRHQIIVTSCSLLVVWCCRILAWYFCIFETPTEARGFLTRSVEIMSWVFEGCLWNFCLSLLQWAFLNRTCSTLVIHGALQHKGISKSRVTWEISVLSAIRRTLRRNIIGAQMRRLRHITCEGSWIWCMTK